MEIWSMQVFASFPQRLAIVILRFIPNPPLPVDFGDRSAFRKGRFMLDGIPGCGFARGIHGNQTCLQD